MAYTRTYRSTIPVEPDADLEVMRWLMRESFERTATGDSLRITDYQESEVDAADVPPKAANDLGRPVTDFRWFAFTATATVAPDLIAADA